MKAIHQSSEVGACVILHSKPANNKLSSDFITADNVKGRASPLSAEKPPTVSWALYCSFTVITVGWLLAMCEPDCCLFNDAANTTEYMASNGKDDY